MKAHVLVAALALSILAGWPGLTHDGTATALWLRGYAILPAPQKVVLSGGDFPFGSDWQLQLGPGVAASDQPVTTLQTGLRRTHGWELPAARGSNARGEKILRLELRPGAAAAGTKPAIGRQAYLIELSPARVTVTGNDQPGLFYGVQSFLQLLRSGVGARASLPEGRIEDWPDLELREMHWDTKHHQDRLETMKEYLDRASEFKINAVGWEIEDKFAYRKHPAIGAPGAFSADQVRELVAYARARHIEIIPLLQGPSHMAYVLKHPEFAPLREDVNNNYMICPSREASWKLIFDMYDEILAATPGAKYFHVATDEAYFAGQGKECGCAEKARNGGPSRIFVEFMQRAGRYLEERGRQVMFWGEDPLATSDIPKLPPTLIDAVAGDDEQEIAAERAHGMRLMIYTSSQGVRPLFPEYFPQNYPEAPAKGRLASLYREIAFSPARQADLLGTFTAAWDDSGLHNEVFWLGWVAGSSWGWHRETPEPEEFTAQFMKLFYGPEASGMTEVYRLTDAATQFWAASWDRVPAERGPSYKKYMNWDETLALPALPSAVNLSNQPFWRDRYQKLLARTDLQVEATERLIALLHDNLGRVRRNRYNLEVLLAQAKFTRHNLSLLRTLAQVEDVLTEARTEHSRLQYANAAERLEGAHQLVSAIVRQREAAYQELVATWEKSRYPKGQPAGGRQFVHVMDDTKDHWADRTPDLSYLVMRERKLGLEGWLDQLKKVRDEYMRVHKANLAYAQDEK